MNGNAGLLESRRCRCCPSTIPLSAGTAIDIEGRCQYSAAVFGAHGADSQGRLDAARAINIIVRQLSSTMTAATRDADKKERSGVEPPHPKERQIERYSQTHSACSTSTISKRWRSRQSPPTNRRRCSSPIHRVNMRFRRCRRPEAVVERGSTSSHHSYYDPHAAPFQRHRQHPSDARTPGHGCCRSTAPIGSTTVPSSIATASRCAPDTGVISPAFTGSSSRGASQAGAVATC